MLVIWGRATSSNVMKVVWLLQELGLPYERHDVGGPFGGTDTSEYRAMNPTGLIPTLDDAGFILWESNSILRYLCNAHAPQTPFYPTAPRERANVEHWMDFQQSMVNPPMGSLFRALIRTPEAQRDPAQIARDTAGFCRAMAMLEPMLAQHPYVAGEQLSLADMALGPLLHRFFALPIERPALPGVRAWYDRLLTRPAYATHVALDLV